MCVSNISYLDVKTIKKLATSKNFDLLSVSHPLQGTDKYVLRMADDDWDPDLDFPGLDSSAVITDVGVDQFVLCHQVSALCSLLARLRIGSEVRF